ncbi:hypothetical protein B0T20DRAFT_213080 [Sordaria brevicollis]|uniref:Uncharacterized protein n=1 Tax=Sordaria brevicollis TaxID=83679 RepID=A0AAE0PEQ5_SORBR|nr:hypothetical protein B0T20DRAFT_213080 [Sordaria brevicollis]
MLTYLILRTITNLLQHNLLEPHPPLTPLQPPLQIDRLPLMAQPNKLIHKALNRKHHLLQASLGPQRSRQRAKKRLHRLLILEHVLGHTNPTASVPALGTKLLPRLGKQMVHIPRLHMGGAHTDNNLQRLDLLAIAQPGQTSLHLLLWLSAVHRTEIPRHVLHILLQQAPHHRVFPQKGHGVAQVGGPEIPRADGPPPGRVVAEVQLGVLEELGVGDAADGRREGAKLE